MNHDMKELRNLVIGFLVGLTLVAMLSTGLAHCQEISQQTTQEIICMYIKHKNPGLNTATGWLIATEIASQTRVAGIPYEIITAIMCVESCYDPCAVGPKGEIGLMQIYTMTCDGVKISAPMLHVVWYNIAAGICLFTEKLVQADGDMMEAIKRYNGSGPKADKFRTKVCSVVLDIFRFRVAELYKTNTKRKRTAR